MAQRYFTVAEANALLPEVRRLLAQIRRALARLEEIKAALPRDGDELAKPAADTLVAPDHFRSVHLFHLALERFGELGIELKDLGRGLVDFPSRRADEEVRLCWREGEKSVLHFHDLESGFEGRKPIEELVQPPPVPPEEPDEEG